MDNNCYLTLLDALREAAERIEEGQQIESNAETWDIYNLIEAAEQSDEEPLDGDKSYYCVGWDGGIGLTHNDGVNVEWIYTIKPAWGGKREGSGRPSTGRKKVNFYVTEEEADEIRKLINMLRNNE